MTSTTSTDKTAYQLLKIKITQRVTSMNVFNIQNESAQVVPRSLQAFLQRVREFLIHNLIF